MTAEQILDLLAHPRFLRLNSVSGGWSIVYADGTASTTSSFITDSTLDKLLERFAEIMEGTCTN